MIEELLPNLFVIHPDKFSSNVYLLKGNKITLIDSGSTINLPNLKNCLNELNISPEDIKLILLTHAHSDHISGCEIFENAEIWSSKYDGEFINNKHKEFTASNFFKQHHIPIVHKYYEKNQQFDLGEFELEIIETPGHTEGSVCIYEKKNKILFSGDTLFKGSYGRYDLLSGDKEKLKQSLKKLKELDFKYLLPGHNEILKGNQKQNIDTCLDHF